MAKIALHNDFILLTRNREVLFINTSDITINKLVLPPCQTNVKKVKIEGGSEIKMENQDESKIEHIAVSLNNDLVALTTSGDKLLYLYRIIGNTSTELISKRELSRTSNAVRFSPDSQELLVADKTGDCYVFDCDNPDIPGKCLLAHFSMVMDISFTQNKQFIITCDRDEKIRVTNYPETHIIETYCLGHTEYVYSINFLPTNVDTTLVSVSGDKTIKLWNFMLGIEIIEFKLPAGCLNMALSKIDNKNHIAVVLLEHCHLVIYEITCDNNTFQCKLISEHSFPNTKRVSSLLYDKHGNLILTIIDDNNKVFVRKLEYFEGVYKLYNMQNWNEAIANSVGDIEFNSDDELCILFKKKFDNIHDYQERKKRRIDEKNKKS